MYDLANRADHRPGPNAPKTHAELDLARFLAFARKRSKRYAWLLGEDEAFGVALEALVDARNRWQPERGAFATCADLWIRARLSEAVDAKKRQDGVAWQHRKHGAAYWKRKGGMKHPAAQPHDYALVSGDQPIVDDGSTFFDLIVDEAAIPPDQCIGERQEHAAKRKLLWQSFAALDARERQIVVGHIARGATLDELGDLLGISKERARQIEMRALEKLRRAVAQSPPA